MAYRKGDIPKVKLDIPNAPKFYLNDLTESMSNMDRLFDNIVKDIQEQKDNAMAMEFTKCIGELLKKNGVVPKISEYRMENHAENHTENKIEMRYGVNIDELDFSEHDKVFEDKIAELKKDYKTVSGLLSDYQQENESLKQRIAELESKETENISEIDTSSPLACAESLIEHMTHCEKFMIMPERDVQTFSVKELKEIADYLMVYYRHHRDRDAEETISF
jgi:hypothetical protein